jgi:hypothetical protein
MNRTIVDFLEYEKQNFPSLGELLEQNPTGDLFLAVVVEFPSGPC